VRYREIGKIDWFVGRTDDMSRSGVFIRSAKGVHLASHVEVRVALPPVAIAPAQTAEISCVGRVVRHVSRKDGPRRRSGYGIAIDQYELRTDRGRNVGRTQPPTTMLRLVPRY